MLKLIYVKEGELGNRIGRFITCGIPLIGPCWILIDKRYINDKGLLLHEIIHYKQYRNKFLHSLLYRWDSYYRYHSEIQAYAYQLYWASKPVSNNVVNSIHKHYRLPSRYTTDKIYDDLKKELASINPIKFKEYEELLERIYDTKEVY